MINFIILFLTSLGLGHIASIVLKDTSKNFGKTLIVGFSLLPVVVFLITSIFRIPLSITSQIIFLTGLAGTGLLIVTWKKHFKEVFFHPIFLMMWPLMFLFLAVGITDYFAIMTDEFSHWLLTPKQMFIHDSLPRKDFPIIRGTFAYTPGWPLLITFSSFVYSSSFNIGMVVGTSFFCILVLLIFIHDYFKFTDSKKSRNLAWLVPLLILIIKPIDPVFPGNVLIEIPIIYILISFFMMMTLINENKISSKPGLFYLGIMLANAYLLKVALYALIPSVVLFISFFDFKREIEGGSAFREKLKKMLTTCALFVLCFTLWKLHVSSIFDGSMSGQLGLQQILEKISSRVVIIPKVFLGIIKYPIGGRWWYQILRDVLLVSFFVLSLRDRQKRLVSAQIIIFAVTYVAGLLWVYLVVFSDYEAYGLAAFNRYMDLPYWVVRTFGLFYLIKVLVDSGIFYKIGQFISKTRFIKFAKAVPFQVVVVILFLIIGARMHRNYRKVNLVENSMMKGSKELIKLIEQKNMNNPLVQLISQKENNGDFVVALYRSVGVDGKYHYKMNGGYSWGEKSANTWMAQTTVKKLKEHFNKADILWVEKTDDWMNKVLRSFDLSSNCSLPYTRYFFVREGRNKFRCVKKISS